MYSGLCLFGWTEWCLCNAFNIPHLPRRKNTFQTFQTDQKKPKKQPMSQCHNVTMSQYHSDSAFSAVAASQVWRGEHTRARTDLTAEKTKKLLWELRTDLKGSRYREIRSKRQWQRHLICSPTRAATSLVPSGCRTQDASNRFKPLHR